MDNTTNLASLFSLLGLDEKSQRLFTTLYRLGPNPASVIARYVGLKRPTTYRLLKELEGTGIVRHSVLRGIQVFFVEHEYALLNIVKQRRRELEQAQENYEDIAASLRALKPVSVTMPQLVIYDNPTDLALEQRVFGDIMKEMEEQHVTTIRLIASNTFEEQLGNTVLSDVASPLVQALKNRDVKIDILAAEGMLTRERLHRHLDLEHFLNLPAQNGASNMYLVGETVFLLFFKEHTSAIKIRSADFAQTMHFLFDQLVKGR